MKKLSIILLALALAVAFALPAVAGDFSIKGKYVLDAETADVDGTESAWYDDDLDVDIDVTQGDVKFHWDIEVSDGYLAGHANDNANLVDGYYVQWAVNDALTFKAGEWGLGFGRAIAMDNQGGGNLGVMYGLDAVDLALWIGKEVEEGAGGGGDDLDTEDIQLVATFKEVGPLTKLALTYLVETNEAADTSENIMAVDFALPAGPVDLAIEYGAQGGDNIDGTYMIVEIGLDEVVGFDLGLTYFASDLEFDAYFGEDYDVTYKYGDVTDITWIRVAGSYAVNDDLTVGAKAVVSAENDDGDDMGTAMDVYANYKFADNVSSSFTYGTIAEGDAVTGVVDVTGMRARVTFSF